MKTLKTFIALIHDDIRNEVYEERVTLGLGMSEETLASTYANEGKILLLLREAE